MTFAVIRAQRSAVQFDSDMDSLSADLEKVPTLPTKIDPLLALELRLRWLEALIFGVKQDLGRPNLKHGETVSKLAETVQRNLNKAVQGNEGLTKFMDQCMFFFSFTFWFIHAYSSILLPFDIDDQHAPLLIPSFVLPDTAANPPTYDKMSAEELDAYLTEMEPEIRTADREMLEVEALEKRGVTGAGRLLGKYLSRSKLLLMILGFIDYEDLQPRLKVVLDAYEEDVRLANSLESRIASLVERHTTYVCLT